MYAPYFKPDPGVYETLQGEYDTVAGYALPLVKYGERYYLAAISVSYNPLGYRLTTKDGLVYHTHQSEGLQSITDRNGVKLSFSRDGITSSTGESITFNRDPQGRITSIIDPNSEVIRYEYDVSGDLIASMDQAGDQTVYKYNSEMPHRIEAIRDPSGVRSLSIEYSQTGRMATTTDLLSGTHHFQYDPSLFTEVVTDSLGQATTITHDERGNVLSTIDPLGRITKYTYDNNDNPLSMIDARGFVTVRSFDARGNATSITDPLGRSTSYTYDKFNHILTTTDSLGNVTEKIYDTRGNLIAQFNPGCPCPSEITYDSFGRVTSATDSRGYTTAFGYTNFAYPSLVIRPDGNTKIVNYIGTGLPIESIDENGHRTIFTYTTANKLAVVKNPDGMEASVTYANGQVASYTDAGGRTTRFEYNAAGQRTMQINPLGTIWSYTYDSIGQMVSETDPTGVTTKYTYDAAGQKASKSVAGIEHHYDYDATGNLVSITDPNGHTTLYNYDGNNRLTRETSPLGHEMTFEYDPLGRKTVEIDPAGYSTTYEYDEQGRIVRTINSIGSVWAMTYDGVGNKTSVTDPNGHITSWTFDSRNRVIAQQNALGGVERYEYDGIGNKLTNTDALGRVTRWSYDQLDRVQTMTNALGGVERYEYDAVNNKTLQIDSLGRSTQYEYDAHDQLITKTDAIGGVWTYTYDAWGSTTAVSDPLGNTTLYGYDSLHRRTAVTDAEAGVSSYQYDGIGNALSWTDPTGGITTFTYDADYRLTATTDPEGSTTTLEYDVVGRVTKVVDPLNRAWLTSYNSIGWATSRTDPSGDVTLYQYDPIGNRVSETDPLGRTMSYGYDALNRLVSETDPYGRTDLFVFDPVGNRISVTDAVGNKTQFEFDALNRVVLETNALGYSSQSDYNLVGNLTRYTDRNGRLRTFEYDDLNRRTQESWWDGAAEIRRIDYTYDSVGNLVSVTDPKATLSFAYDARNLIDTADNVYVTNDLHVTLQYQRDLAGRVIAVEDDKGIRVQSAYNLRGELTNRTWANPVSVSASIEFGYDAAGQRNFLRRLAGATLLNAGRTDYSYELDGLANHIVHRNSYNDVLAEYVFARDAAGQIISRTHHGESEIFSYDLVGQLTMTDRSVGQDESFSFDDTGNRTTGTVIGVGNQLLADEQYDYAYDGEGNLISRIDRGTLEISTYLYDYRNRLIQVEVRSATNDLLHLAEYQYDPLDRLISRQVDGTEFWTVYDGANPWADYDSTGAVRAQYLFGDRPDEILARWRQDGELAWYLSDHLGTIHDLVDANGDLINHVEYGSFGEVLFESDPAAGDRFKFTGREYDPTTGLYYYRARWFNPQTGRFNSPDPVGFAAGDLNLYRYVGNAPTLATDPYGTTAWLEQRLTQGFGTALAGGVLGWICGFLDGIAEFGFTEDPAVKARVVERANESAVIGGVIGFVIGYTAGTSSTFSQAAGTFWAGVGGYAGGLWIGSSGNVWQAGVRTACVFAPVLGPKLFEAPPGRPGATPPPRRGPTGCFVAGTEVITVQSTSVVDTEAERLDALLSRLLRIISSDDSLTFMASLLLSGYCVWQLYERKRSKGQLAANQTAILHIDLTDFVPDDDDSELDEFGWLHLWKRAR